MSRRSRALVFSLLVLTASLTAAAPPAAAREDGGARVESRRSVAHGVSRPFRDIGASGETSTSNEQTPALRRGKPPRAAPTDASALDDEQVSPRASEPRTPVPTPTPEFEGIANAEQSVGHLPPDTNGDVGETHYVQMVNTSWKAWTKDGIEAAAIAELDPIWEPLAGTTSPCETAGQGDPIVVYDELAGRWLLSQFAFAALDGPFHQCVALSQTEDPTGTYDLYDFVISDTKFNDYPKIGVWHDGYYMTVNQYDLNSGEFLGAAVVAFDREDMLDATPGPADMVYVDLETFETFQGFPTLYGMLPVDVDGPFAPPTGSPGQFLMFDDVSPSPYEDDLRIFTLDVDWTTNTGEFLQRAVIPLLGTDPGTGNGFDSNLCDYAIEFNCIPTPALDPPGPNGFPYLDGISDRLMWRAAYRNFGTHESVVLNHTVDWDGSPATGDVERAGIRWYEIRDTSWSPRLHQAGTFTNGGDSIHRWMGSIAMDAAGNMALGYSASNIGMEPDIRLAGRLSSDQLGTLGAETVMVNGTGNQTSSSGRWGDYSSMSVDPSDDCTFWYTNEYYAATSSTGWQSRIGAFKFDGCVPLDAPGSVSGTIRRVGTSTAIPGATVRLGVYTAETDALGDYEFTDVPPGTYEMTVWKDNEYETNVVPVVVTTGANTIPDVSLTPAPRAFADFNGDGYGDVAAGAPSDRFGGTSKGSVNVIYGSATGLEVSTQRLFNQDSAGVGGVAETSDFFGSALAAGDFNGDGYTDLAIGSYGETIGGDTTTGQVNVLYGGAAGLSGSGSQLWYEDAAGVIGACEDGDQFGAALAAGDFDADGKDDLAVGAPGENADAGSVHVLYGSASKLTASGDQHWHQDSPGIESGMESGDLFGFSLAAGNFGKTGSYDDLAIGAPLEDVGSDVDSGVVNVIYGAGSAGLGASGDELWYQDQTGVGDSNEDGDRFGWDVAAGNFDGDAFADLAVGVPLEDISTAPNAGAVNVIYGTASSGLASAGNQFWHQNRAGVDSGAATDEQFGFDVAAGDFNADERDDLAVGVPTQNVAGGLTDAGGVNVLYGRDAAGLASTNDELWFQLRMGPPHIQSDPFTVEVFGFSVAAGDVNGDGRADLLVGSPGESMDAIESAGALSVLNGAEDGLAPWWTNYWSQDLNLSGTPFDGENLGWTIAA